MRALTFFHQGNEISIHNNLIGIESVYYNDKKMTAHFSLCGSTHDFSVMEEDVEVNYQVKISMSIMVGITFSIWRNGRALLLGSGYRKRTNIASAESDFV